MTRLRRRRPADERPVCVCGCDPETHAHWRTGTDCGRCSRLVCPHYRADLHAVCRDNQLVDAVTAGHLDHARTLTDHPELVDLLAALAATGRPTDR